MTTLPKRIQCKRTGGWRMPEGAVYVGRSTKFDNPYILGSVRRWTGWYVGDARDITVNYGEFATRAEAAARAVELYRERSLSWSPETIDTVRRELAGKDLACWCPLVDADGNRVPCHADVLLSLANTPPPPPPSSVPSPPAQGTTAAAAAAQLAQLFHETYETLAPLYGYRTREASAVSWAEVPEQNRAVMVHTASRVLEALEAADRLAGDDQPQPATRTEWGVRLPGRDGITVFRRREGAERARQQTPDAEIVQRTVTPWVPVPTEPTSPADTVDLEDRLADGTLAISELPAAPAGDDQRHQPRRNAAIHATMALSRSLGYDSAQRSIALRALGAGLNAYEAAGDDQPQPDGEIVRIDPDNTIWRQVPDGRWETTGYTPMPLERLERWCGTTRLVRLVPVADDKSGTTDTRENDNDR